jgi:hypothetical protein
MKKLWSCNFIIAGKKGYIFQPGSGLCWLLRAFAIHPGNVFSLDPNSTDNCDNQDQLQFSQARRIGNSFIQKVTAVRRQERRKRA